MNSQPQDLDLSRVLAVLRRALPTTLLAALLLAAASYLISRAQPATYEATASVAALPSGNSNSVISASLVTAPPVPPAVVDAALHSNEVTQKALAQLAAGALSPAQLAQLRLQLQAELQGAQVQTVVLRSQVDQDQTGLYSITARAQSPAVAREVANAFTTALLDWDRGRALESVRRAQLNLAAQRDSLGARLQTTTDDTQRRSLISARGNVLQALDQLAVLDRTVSGTLSLLSGAVAPLRAASPRPVRDALIVLAFTFFLGLLAAGLLDVLRRRVRGAADLDHLPTTVVGTLPVMARLGRDPAALLPRLRQSVYGEQMEFVRVALQHALAAQGHPTTVVVSSAQAGEGKSTVVAGLASSLAASGQRVLVFDADVHKPRQQLIWKPAAGAAQRPAAGLVHHWSAVAPNVSLAVPEAKQLDADASAGLLKELGHGYDFVLVDTPPMLSVAETLALAARTDGLLLVVNRDTLLSSAERAVQEALQLGVKVVGVVLNRSQSSRAGQYYSYLPVEVER